MKFSKTLLVLPFVSLLALAASALEAKVLSTSGKVEVQNGSSWVALKSGDTVKSGTVISTGFKSSAELDVNGSKVTLGALTRMTVEKLVSTDQKNESSLFLDSGKVTAEVKKTDGKRTGFKVSTPVATASVRGTSFSMGADGSLTTMEGLVSKGHAESQSAQVSDQASDYVPAEGESTALTSTEDVSGSYGIPVFAGQTSTTDVMTGTATAPQAEAAKASANLGSGTETLASQEKVVTAVSVAQAAPATVAPAPSSGGGGKGTLIINITFAE